MVNPEYEARRALEDSGWDGKLPVNPVRVADYFGIEVFRDQDMVGTSNSGRCVITENGDKIIIRKFLCGSRPRPSGRLSATPP